MPRLLDAVSAPEASGVQHIADALTCDELRMAIGNVQALGDLLQLAAETRANFMKGTLDAVACMLTREAAFARECLDEIERNA